MDTNNSVHNLPSKIFWKETTGAAIGGAAFLLVSAALVYIVASGTALPAAGYWGLVGAEFVSFALIGACLYRLQQKTEAHLLKKLPAHADAPDAGRVELPPTQVQALSQADVNATKEEKKVLLTAVNRYFISFIEAHARSTNGVKNLKENKAAINNAVAAVQKILINAAADVKQEQELTEKKVYPFLAILLANFLTMETALEKKVSDTEIWAITGDGWLATKARNSHLNSELIPPIKRAIDAMDISEAENKVFLESATAIFATIFHQTAPQLAAANNPLRLELKKFLPEYFDAIRNAPQDTSWPELFQYYSKVFNGLADKLDGLFKQ